MPFDQVLWDAWQKASASGHIRYLYKFTVDGRVDDTVIGYCTGSDVITYDGVTYIPYPCVHEEIKKEADDAETSINIAANKLWLSLLFLNNPRKLHGEIIRYRTELLMGATLYRGDMKNRTLNNNVIKLEFGSSFASSNTNMITYYTQRFCNHAQYDYYCGLNFDELAIEVPAAQYEIEGRKTIHFVDGFTLNTGNDYWKNLILLYTVSLTEDGFTFRYEQDNIANLVTPEAVTLKYPLSAIMDDTAHITLAPNCLLQLTRCKNLFGNLPRACGWPDMPLKNYAALDATQEGKGDGGPRSAPNKSPLRV